jgi:hypothetical protein
LVVKTDTWVQSNRTIERMRYYGRNRILTNDIAEQGLGLDYKFRGPVFYCRPAPTTAR